MAGVLCVLGAVTAAPASAAPVDQGIFAQEFVAQASRFQAPTARLALETTARLRLAAPDFGDAFDIRVHTFENPDGSLEASVTGAPTGDIHGVCGAQGPCYVTTDGGSTWLTGQRPKQGIPGLDDDLGGYDPFEWSRREVPLAQSYDISGRTFTIVIDEDSRISMEFSRRSATATGTLTDDAARGRIDAKREFVAPKAIRLPR